MVCLTRICFCFSPNTMCSPQLWVPVPGPCNSTLAKTHKGISNNTFGLTSATHGCCSVTSPDSSNVIAGNLWHHGTFPSAESSVIGVHGLVTVASVCTVGSFLCPHEMRLRFYTVNDVLKLFLISLCWNGRSIKNIMLWQLKSKKEQVS